VARPRNNPVAPDITPGQAKWVIQRLISERRVAAGEIQRYVSDMQREIGDLERQLASLREAHGGSSSYSSSASVSSSSGTAGTTGARRGRKPGRKPGRPSKASIAAAAAAQPAGGDQAVRKRRGRPPRSASAGASGPQSSGSNAGTDSGARAGRGAKRTRSAITPEQLASRQLQGRYLALIRQIPANRRGPYAKIAKEKGREQAIRELQDAVKK